MRIALKGKIYLYDDNPLKFLKKPMGYGYGPEDALISVAAVCVIGWVVYWRANRMRMMIP